MIYSSVVTDSNRIFKSGKPNYIGLKLPINQFWNLDTLEQMLSDYHDNNIVQFLRFGWPISHNGQAYSSQSCDNWKGVNVYPVEVRKYLDNELKHKSVIDHFKTNPFAHLAGIPPLNTCNKKDSSGNRIILDPSFPEGSAVNDGINHMLYLGVKIEWDLSTLDNLAEFMIVKGISCLLFKRDLNHYYRQIFVDPADIPKLGYQFQQELYFNATLPMGMMSSCYIVQRLSSAIMFLKQKRGFSCVNYIDDLGRVESPEKDMKPLITNWNFRINFKSSASLQGNGVLRD